MRPRVPTARSTRRKFSCSRLWTSRAQQSPCQQRTRARCWRTKGNRTEGFKVFSLDCSLNVAHSLRDHHLGAVVDERGCFDRGLHPRTGRHGLLCSIHHKHKNLHLGPVLCGGHLHRHTAVATGEYSMGTWLAAAVRLAPRMYGARLPAVPIK